MANFTQQVALVTGGTAGIGQALCEQLGAQGAIVIVAGRNMERAAAVVAQIKQRGGQAQVAYVDVSIEHSVAELIEQTVAEHGRLDYIFNNAGIGVMGEVRDLTLAHWRTIVDVNMWGVIYGTHHAYQVMLRQGSGHIVNIASGAGLFPITYTVPYSAVKHAVVALSLALRAEATQLGVKVSVACPGAVRSNIDQTSHVVNSRRDVMEKFLQQGMSTNDAARIILEGVARNRANIVFPGSLRFMWWLARFSPALWRWLSLQHIRVLRTKVRLPTQPMASR